MDLGVFYEVIVPLMEVEGTAMICISTPLGPWNFYSELTEIRDDKGKLIFNVIRVGMACRRCKGTDKEGSCTHPSSDRPDWKPEETFDKVKAIFGDRKTLLQREIMGIVSEDGTLAFEIEHLKRFTKLPPPSEPHNLVEVVYMSVDPNGGSRDGTGSGSETAIVSFFYQGGNIVICGLSNHPTKNGTETRELCRSHLAALRSQGSCFRQSRVCVIPEVNLGNEAQEIANTMIRMPGVSVLCAVKDGYGIRTDPGIKSKYVFRFTQKLAEGAIRYHKTLYNGNPFITNKSDAQKSALAKKEFERQLKAFRRVVELPGSLSTMVRQHFTGKADKDNKQTNRLRDDLVMAALFGIYFSGELMVGYAYERGYMDAFEPDPEIVVMRGGVAGSRKRVQ